MIRLVDLVERQQMATQVRACSNILSNPLNTINDVGRVADDPIVVEDREDTLTICANNREDDTFDAELRGGEMNENDEDVNVDIMEYSKFDSVQLFEDSNHDDDTESSTSFSDDISDPENELNYSDADVNSHYPLDDTLAIAYVGFSNRSFPRKRLADNWKNYIRPIKWRCTWFELKIKELRVKASRYEKELAQNRQAKQYELGKYSVDVGSRCIPFRKHSRRRHIMKRKRRKPLEDKIDIASQISNHNTFSYFGNPKPFVKCEIMDDTRSKRVIPKDDEKKRNDECEDNKKWTSFYTIDDDDSIENILSNVFELQKNVHNLKTRYKELESKIFGNSASENLMNLFAGCNALDSSPENSSENTDDLFIPKDASVSYRELSVLMHGVESKDRAQVEESNLKVEETLIDNPDMLFPEDTLIDNPIMLISEDVSDHSIPVNPVSEVEQQSLNTSTEVIVKSFTNPKTRVPVKKRKRGKYKRTKRIQG